MSCEFTPMSAHQVAKQAQQATHRCGNAAACKAPACAVRCHATDQLSTPEPTLTAAEVEARELAETLAQERLWMAWLMAGAGVVVVASFSLGYLTAALSLG